VFVRGVRLVDVHHHSPLEVGEGGATSSRRWNVLRRRALA
jgi:hypothetical protein